MSVDWERLLASGELKRIAVESPSRAAFAARLGMSEQRARKQMESRGIPTFSMLKFGNPHQRTSHGPDADFSNEEPTNPAASLFDVSDAAYRDPDTGIDISIPTDASRRTGSHLPLLPPGHRYNGVSTLLDGDGNVRAQWQKTSVSKEQYREALLRAVAEIAEDFRGQLDPIVATSPSDEDLMAIYTIGDAHLGMMAHADETGANHDLATGRRDLIAAVDHLVNVAPAAKLGIVLSLGDLVHFDNESGTTTKGTRIDADTRWYKVMRSTIDTARHCIDRALEKHGHVRAIFIRGNHDRHASAAVAMALACAYEREPRVTIDQSADPYSWIRFGKVLVGANHSDENSKPEALAGVMACDRAADWGECPYRYMLCGHLHHTYAKEELGVLVERFPTLAPKDAWHHGKGYRAQQSMCVDTYHREWGRVNRSTVGIRQLRSL